MKFDVKVFWAAIFVTMASNAASTSAPITFEENRGPKAGDIAFLGRAAGYRVALMRDGALITPTGGKTVRIVLADASQAIPAGVDRLAAKSNNLIGSNRARWRTGISNYASVRYARVYPGIDLVWHGRDGAIEHDFVISARADPGPLWFDIEGVTLAVDRSGNLVAGGLRLERPRAYQNSRETACRYKLDRRGVGFVLGAYDRSRPLTIDPVLSFSTFLGGSGQDQAAQVALDGAGNIYVAGTRTSTNFPVSAKAVQSTFTGGNCGLLGMNVPCRVDFVSKFAPDGSTLLFSTYLGGSSGQNSVNGMAVDKSGSVYLTGMAGGRISGSDAACEYAPAARLVRGETQRRRFLGGLRHAASTRCFHVAYNPSLAVDATGSVYITGATYGSLPLVNPLQSTISKPLVFKTTDSAVHWQGLTNGVPSDLVDSITADPIRKRCIWVRTAASIRARMGETVGYSYFTTRRRKRLTPAFTFLRPRSQWTPQIRKRSTLTPTSTAFTKARMAAQPGRRPDQAPAVSFARSP